MSRIYRVFSILSLFVVLTFVLVIPGYAYFDPDSTVVVDQCFQSLSGQTGTYTKLFSVGMPLGSDYETSVLGNSYAKYFRNEFFIRTNNGTNLFNSGDRGVLTLENFYLSLDAGSSGFRFLKGISKIDAWYFYSDGSGETITYDISSFFTDNDYIFLNVPVDVKKDVVSCYLSIYFDVTDFNFSFNETFDDFVLNVGSNDFNYYFTPSYSSADPGVLDDYENSERELFDATSGGIGEITSVTNNLTQAFAPSSSIYRGAMFFGNMMSDIVGQIPDLNMIILVSLAIGIVTIIIGFASEYAGRRIGRANNEARSEARYKRRAAERKFRKKKGG